MPKTAPVDRTASSLRPGNGAVVVLGLLPLITLPGAFAPYFWPRVTFLLVALGVWFWGTRGETRATWGNLESGIVGTLLVWFAAAAVAGGHPIASLVGRYPRYEGLVVVASYVCCAIIGGRVAADARAGCPRGLARVRAFTIACAVSALLLAVVGVVQAVTGPDGARVGSTLGNASDLGAIAVPLLAVLAGSYLTRRDTWSLVGAGGAVISLGLSGSRGAYLGAAVVGLILAVAAVRAGGVPRRVWTWGLTATTAVLAVVLALPTSRERLLSAETVAGRFELWTLSVGLVGEHPWGLAPSGFVDSLPAALTERAVLTIGTTHPHDSPHNLALQALVTGGWPMLGLALALAGAVTWRVLRSPSHSAITVVAAAVVLGYAATLLTHFTSPATTPLAAMALGTLLTVDRPVQESRSKGRLDLALGLSASVAAVVALLGWGADVRLAQSLDALRAGDVVGAAEGATSAQDLRPWDSDLCLLLSQGFAAAASNGLVGSAAEAQRWANCALDTTPQSIEAALALAVGQIADGDSDEASATLDRALVRSPFDPQLLVQSAVSHAVLGDLEAAWADVQAAQRLAPDLAAPWLVAAWLYDLDGDAGAAAAARSEASKRTS